MRFGLKALAVALSIGMLLPSLASAQGGGASSTGTIQGRVADTSGAILPGVSVTATSPSMIGTQTQVTNENGTYRFPAVPPGTYELSFELAGFNTVKRSGIQISLGFTANVNVDLAVATLQETVTVSGASPVIDTSATRVQQNFKLEQLNSIPNGRDMWALLAATPGVVMSSIDIGGNRAGTQTGYRAYGLSGQVRTSVEGINTTEGTDSAGFYYDYGSFEEVFMGVAGQGAEAATPGVQTNLLGKSGGNKFSGEFYQDFYNNSMQGSNLSEIYTRPTSQGGYGFRPGSNEMDHYYDTNFNIGGPIKKDKAWFNVAWRRQFNAVQQPLFTFDKTFDTWNVNPSAKVTYQLNQKNKIIGYYQWNMKDQPNRLPLTGYTYTSPEQTVAQHSPSWVYKGEWNGTLSDRIYVEARWGDFGYYDPRLANSDEDYFWRDTGALVLTGAHQESQTDRDRKQTTGAATYFLDTKHGSHTFKLGGELYKETQWNGRTQNVGGNIEHIYANGVSSQLVFGVPTATCVCGRYASDNGQLLVVNKLDQQDFFLNDTWAMGRVSVNMGIRWDRYKGWMPEQEQMAYALGPVNVPAQSFPEQDFFTWNNIGPRIGFTYDLAGDGKTVVKASYGLFWHNPGPGVSANANPNQSSKSVTYTWNDQADCAGCIKGDKHFQLGEQSANPTATSLAGTVVIDPNITEPYSHDVTAYLERQVSDAIGARIGFIYKTEDDLIAQYNPGRPISAYTVPYTIVDPGVDGVTGTADDGTLHLLGVPNTADVNTKFPLTNVTQNTPRFSRYKTVEASMNKRMSNKWSAQVGGSYTMAHDFPGAYPNSPNGAFDEDTTRWDFKLSGSYDAPWGIRISPLVRHQAGANFARQISVGAGSATAAGAIFSGTVNVEPLDSNRQDNITVLDTRIDRAFKLGNARLRGFVDLFNLTNTNAADGRTVTTGSAYLRPTSVLAPRTLRIGARFQF
jgi:hypothetical protein